MLFALAFHPKVNQVEGVDGFGFGATKIIVKNGRCWRKHSFNNYKLLCTSSKWRWHVNRNCKLQYKFIWHIEAEPEFWWEGWSFWSSSEVTCNIQCPKNAGEPKKGETGSTRIFGWTGSLQFALIWHKKNDIICWSTGNPNKNQSLVWLLLVVRFFLGWFFNESGSWTSFILRTHTQAHWVDDIHPAHFWLVGNIPSFMTILSANQRILSLVSLPNVSSPINCWFFFSWEVILTMAYAWELHPTAKKQDHTLPLVPINLKHVTWNFPSPF